MLHHRLLQSSPCGQLVERLLGRTRQRHSLWARAQRPGRSPPSRSTTCPGCRRPPLPAAQARPPNCSLIGVRWLFLDRRAHRPEGRPIDPLPPASSRRPKASEGKRRRRRRSSPMGFRLQRSLFPHFTDSAALPGRRSDQPDDARTRARGSHRGESRARPRRDTP